jgi:CBS domain-containing protein
VATNLIQSRIAEELSSFLPFSKMDKKSLGRLAAETVIRYGEDQELIFQIGDAPQQLCWFVRQGQVSLQKEQNNQLIQVDICEEGELFGLRSLLTAEPYSLNASVHKEALLYGIPIKRLTHVMESNAAVALHFANVLASRIGSDALSKSENTIFKHDSISQYSGQLVVKETTKEPLVCALDISIQAAAELMNVHKVSSIIVVNELVFPLGIVTQADLSRKVATGLFKIDEAVGLIMSSPIICSKFPITYDDASLLMLQHGIKHLVLTEDGSLNAKVTGVITPQDLQFNQQASAQNILKQINKSGSLDDLQRLALKVPDLATRQLVSEVPTLHLTSVVGIINEAIIKKAASLIVISHQILADIKWCWVSMGSMARHEQLFPTDQDNALIYTIPENASSQKNDETYKEALLAFSTSLKNFLVECGFESCPANMMASNPELCLTLTEWKEKFTKWIQTPSPKNVMNSTIFFDMKAVLGEEKLLTELQDFLALKLKEHPDFLTYLAADALKNPLPIGFFKQFVVEKDGAHKDQFDIKARALMPLVDMARLFALASGYTSSIDTAARFTVCAKDEEHHEKLFLSAAKAHQQLLLYRFKAYKKAENSGRFLSLNELDTFDKQVLKQCFKPIDELKQIIEVRFNTAMLRR